MDALLDGWRWWEPLIASQCQAWLRHLAWAIVCHLVVLWPLLRLWIALVRGGPIAWQHLRCFVGWISRSALVGTQRCYRS